MARNLTNLTREEFFALFDARVHESILATIAAFPTATHLVCFECQQLDSSQLGQRTSLVVGPDQTFKSVEIAADQWLHDLPSQRQYPTAYWRIER